jgi:hypothetical protein
MFSRWIVTNITSASVTTFLAFLAGIISWSVYCMYLYMAMTLRIRAVTQHSTARQGPVFLLCAIAAYVAAFHSPSGTAAKYPHSVCITSKLKLSLWLRIRPKKVQVQLHIFLTFAQDGGDLSATRSGHFTSGKVPLYQLDSRLGVLKNTSTHTGIYFKHS